MRTPYDSHGEPIYPEDVLDPEELAAYYQQTNRPWGGQHR